MIKAGRFKIALIWIKFSFAHFFCTASENPYGYLYVELIKKIECLKSAQNVVVQVETAYANE